MRCLSVLILALCLLGAGAPARAEQPSLESLYRLSAGTSCPASVALATGTVAAFDLLRCEASYGWSRGKEDALATARAKIRAILNAGDDAPAQLTRAIYCHLCSLQLAEQRKHYPGMAITCFWHLGQLDDAKLADEIRAISPSDQATVKAHVAAARKTITEKTLAAFPREQAPREWEVFYELPSRILKEYRVRASANAAAVQVLAEFNQKLRAGESAGCSGPLRQRLHDHMKGHGSSLAEATARMTDPLGYALTETLAKCHFYNQQELRAGALLSFIDSRRRLVRLAEQIWYTQVDELSKDREKADKYPQLVGRKLSSVEPQELGTPEVLDDSAEANWRSKVRELRTFSTQEGTVQTVERTRDRAIVRFKKEKVPLVEETCRETNRIDRIDRDGKVVYRQDCMRAIKGTTLSSPEPAALALDDAAAIVPGSHLKVARRDGDVAVLLSGPSSDTSARLSRIADVIIE